jgi:Ca-activated chloride channel homolog
MSRFISLFITAIFAFTSSLSAQEAGRTILVFDASGSMWGQIDGKPKITIAQEVINGLLGTIPETQSLGLMAYGHRRKGDCSDIETLVAPGTGNREAISRAVNAIKPKGKTPLSAAVIKAAEELKYTEDKATVILISDGRETCNLNTCEVGTALEEAGIDFTAHVIGFDVAKKADRAQLQCLAENTGGKFLTASNAEELTEALLVVAKPEPALPKQVQIRFGATDGADGPTIFDGIVWQLTNTDTGEVLINMRETDTLLLNVKPGTYKAEVLRIKDEAYMQAVVIITPDSERSFMLALPQFKPLATLDLPKTAVAGSTINVGWSGPNEDRDYLSTAAVGVRDGKYITYSYTSNGQTLGLQMPPTPGTYEIRYVLNSPTRVLARETIEILPFEVSIDLPETALVGETLMLDWRGPDYARDYLSTANPDDRGGQFLTYSYTEGGQPLGLKMPAEPGNYEVRYVLNQDSTVVFRQMIAVGEVTAQLNAPDTAIAGQMLDVDWRGPDYARDYLSVAEIGSRDGQYVNYSYTQDGSPLGLVMPTKPGKYELRYVLNQGNTVLMRKPITITPVSASLNAPQTAVAGQTIVVEWNGPDYARDFITVAEIDARGSQSINYAYTERGRRLKIAMPPKAGRYEIRYVLNQGNTVLARREIEVSAVSATLDVVDQADAGTTITVRWSGPDYARDYVSVAKIGARGSATLFYAYTQRGPELELQLPDSPGQYEIRYVMKQGNTVLASKLITIK